MNYLFSILVIISLIPLSLFSMEASSDKEKLQIKLWNNCIDTLKQNHLKSIKPYKNSLISALECKDLTATEEITKLIEWKNKQYYQTGKYLVEVAMLSLKSDHDMEYLIWLQNKTMSDPKQILLLSKVGKELEPLALLSEEEQLEGLYQKMNTIKLTLEEKEEQYDSINQSN